jgi:hypothetical protein
MERSLKIGPFLPTDYNPPSYQYASNTSVESKNQNKKSETFKITLSAQLSALSAGTGATATAIKYKTLNETTTLNRNFISNFKLSYESVNLNGFQFASWLASLATLRGFLFLFDYIYRAVHTVRLIRKFVGKSAVDLPYVDLRSNFFRDYSVFSGISQWMSYFNYFMELLPFIYIQLLLLIGFIGTSVSYLFLPISYIYIYIYIYVYIFINIYMYMYMYILK